ncbi:MAG TPA: SGNH/GDSL hydrolase family protein [Puia sp.]|jgi:lysophospholipase L1-like esterase
MIPVKTILLMVAISLPQVACKKNTNGQALSYLALGDSYTIGQSVDVSDRYPVQAVEWLRAAGHPGIKDADIIATTGWTTDDLLNAVAAANPPHTYDIVTLLIGVNDQFRGRSQSEYKQQFTTLLQQSIVLAGNKPSHVIVLSIPDYSVTPFAQGSNTTLIASQIDSFNVINRAASVNYKVNYVDVTAESRKAAHDPSLIAGDGLHFSGKEYAIWARLMGPVLQGILK